MVSLSKLLQLASTFTSLSLIQLEEQHCLNMRHPQAACSQCIDICPTNALSMKNKKIQLDTEQCINCGACLWVCPSGAFRQEYASESRLLMTIQQLNDQTIELVCPAAREGAGYVADTTPVLAPRCLGALSPTMLINLAEAQGSVWLNDVQCTDCPLQSVGHLLGKSADIANIWLELYDRDGRVHLISEQQASAHSTIPLIDGSRPAVDRRAFLRGQIRQKTIVDVSEQYIDTVNPVNDRLTYWLPQEKARLLKQEAQWPVPPNQMIYPAKMGFAGVEIDEEKCSMCGWCAGFCPTAALELHHSENMLTITFRPLRCIDCNVCQAACPVDAINKLDTIPLGAVRQSVLLAEEASHSCPQCGNSTANKSGALCIWCNQPQKIDPGWSQLLFQDLDN